MRRLSTLVLGLALPGAAALGVTPHWYSLWDGQAHLQDHGRAIALLPDASVAITGESWHTDGNWAMGTAKFAPGGQLLWSHVYVGPFPGFHVDRGVDVECDAAGNIYTLGTSSGGPRSQGGSDFDIVLIKFAPTGQVLWTRRFDAPGNWTDHATDLAVDAEGNAFISGSGFYSLSDRGFFATDFLVMRYTPEGDLAWTYHTRGPGGRGAIARAVALGPGGDVFAAGQVAGSASGDQDFLVVRLTREGQLSYRTTHSTDGFNTGEDDAQRLAVDDAGNAYVAGQWMPDVTQESPNRHRDTLTMKLSPSGEILWTASTTRDREEEPLDLVVDAQGRVYVGGVWHNTLGADAWLECYSSLGVLLWDHTVGEPDNFDEEGLVGLALDAHGHLFACVTDEEPTPAGEDISLYEFVPAGQVFHRQSFGTGSTTDHAWDFELAPDGSAYFGGYSYRGPATDSDMLVLRAGGDATSCPADLDDGTGTGTPDQGVTIDDLIFFLARFDLGDPAADLDDGSATGTRDQGVTVDDLIYFLDRFSQGC